MQTVSGVNQTLKKHLIKNILSDKDMNTVSNIQAKRMELKEISNTLKELKHNGGITTINEGLLSIYNLLGHQ